MRKRHLWALAATRHGHRCCCPPVATTATTAAAPAAATSAGKVGVILPDASTSPRWEANDRPLLDGGVQDAGIESDIQNADGDTSKFGTICDGMINAGRQGPADRQPRLRVRQRPA